MINNHEAALALKEKIKKKELNFGFQQFMPSPNVTEVAGIAGFDWLWFCTEHGTSGYGTDMENCIRAAENVGVVPFVRLTEPTDHFMYMKAMEAGAKGVIVPRIESKEDMEFAVKAVKWPGGPYDGNHGICGGARRWKYGHVGAVEDPWDYITHDEAETFVIPILETVKAYEDLDAILSVKGIDFAIFGPGDLGMTMGIRGRGKAVWEKGQARMEAYRQQAMKVAKAKGVPICFLFGNVESAKKAIDEGYYILGSSIDASMFRGFLFDMLNEIKKIKRK